MEFSEIPVGTFIKYNGRYAVKTDKTHIMVIGLGSDGFIEIAENEDLEIEGEEEDETGK